MQSDSSRAHIFVNGRVQGVFFRGSAQYEARRLGLAGWVRNLPDGRVESVCEGKAASVEQFIEWCKQGPPSATVTDVSVQYEAVTGEFEDFSTR